jgi:hypothetical protein
MSKKKSLYRSREDKGKPAEKIEKDIAIWNVVAQNKCDIKDFIEKSMRLSLGTLRDDYFVGTTPSTSNRHIRWSRCKVTLEYKISKMKESWNDIINTEFQDFEYKNSILYTGTIYRKVKRIH